MSRAAMQEEEATVARGPMPGDSGKMKDLIERLRDRRWTIRYCGASGFFQVGSLYFKIVADNATGGYKIQESADDTTYTDVFGGQGKVEPTRQAKLVQLTSNDKYFEITIWDNESTDRGPDWVYGLCAVRGGDGNDATGVWLADGQAPPFPDGDGA